ncbi:hypothetical protein A2U01_0098976, partial [Trifolium medium]|nr:hypothetical protein [Trifolium medium]
SEAATGRYECRGVHEEVRIFVEILSLLQGWYRRGVHVSLVPGWTKVRVARCSSAIGDSTFPSVGGEVSGD